MTIKVNRIEFFMIRK